MRKRLAAGLVGLLIGLAVSIAPGSAAAAPDIQTTWFFAEGATVPPFDTWVLLFNPNPNPATATVSFLSNGVIATRTVTIAPNARSSLFVNEFLPNANFGIRVDSSLPIAAERAMYFRQDGTAVTGIPAPSTTWLFAEGSTGFPFDTWFLLMNPNNVTANVTLTFLNEAGVSRTTEVAIAPLSRATIFANQIVPAAGFSTRITSNQPIVAERSMFLTNTGGGHASQGAPAPAEAWFFSEGSTAEPFDTWFLLFNPNPTPVRILMRLFPDVGGPGPLLDFTIPANTRRSLFVDQIQSGISFGATIATEGGPIVAERAMYFQGGAHATIGTPSPASEWFFAEGSTAFPFQEWLLLANPSGEADASATLTFFFPDGTSTSRTVTVPGEGRTSLFIDLFLPQTAVSTRITSNRPIVAERAMYFSEGRGGHVVSGISQ